jgi:predicted ribosome quality control (RQC) complex YloA/Tae2 family protein
MQQVDLTTLIAVVTELAEDWLPAKLEQVYQRDRYTLSLGLRTLQNRGWLTLAWHPQAARLCLDQAPPRQPDTFTFSDQLRHQLHGLALVEISLVQPWERVVDLAFAQRPGSDPLFHLYLEIMGKYSNLILTTGDRQIITCGHQVSAQQSRVRTIQTGAAYVLPPPPPGDRPNPQEDFPSWQQRIALIPRPIGTGLLKTYQGLSPHLVAEILQQTGVDPDTEISTLTPNQWRALWQTWQQWLGMLTHRQFKPAQTAEAYTVMGWGAIAPSPDTSTLLREYYAASLGQQQFQALHQQLQQKVNSHISKLQQKNQELKQRLSKADKADILRHQGDLLMAHLHLWQPGMTKITLEDFTSGHPICIPLQPDKNAIQNAQFFYKQHQKLKRTSSAVLPLLAKLDEEASYLEQVASQLIQMENCPEDFDALQEIRHELIQQGYLTSHENRQDPPQTQFHRYTSPSGYEILIGRNNRQNDLLSFRLASDYDLWLHAQETPGSHVLLRLPPGASLENPDLQSAADLSAYYSRARQSDRVPVVYTKPKYLYKPKGAKPGMVIYKHEKVIWGHPQAVRCDQNQSSSIS